MAGPAFSGLTVGGPLDGRRITHYGSRYETAVTPPVEPIAPPSARDGLASQMIEVERFTYEYFELFGRGFWVPEEIRRRRTFDRQRYEHPADFVITRLSAHYRPEGY